MAVSKKRGIKSSAQDNFLQPDNVTSLSGTDVGTSRPYLATANTTSAASAAGTGGAVSLTWTLPAGSPAATSYLVTTSPSTYEADTGSATASYTFQGLASNTSYTFTVRGVNAAGTASGTTSSSVTATTVPQAPQSATATAGVNQNTIQWTIGATGGKALSKHNVTGSDGTSSGDLASSATSATIADTAGTAQTYTVTATNANGASAGATTSSVTTLSPFFPFFPYFPFFPSFAPPPPPPIIAVPPPPPPPPPPPYFAPPPFFPYFYGFESVAATTGIRTTSGLKNAEDIIVGDKLIAMNIDGIDRTTMTWLDWSLENPTFNESNFVETEVMSINTNTTNPIYLVNGDRYSSTHWILAKKDNVARFVRVTELDTTSKVYSYVEQGFVNITALEVLDIEDTIYSIHCEPYDNFFTENMLVFDAFDAVEGDVPPP
jgi:hypothetical protein